MSIEIDLTTKPHLFQGVVPAIITTCSRSGEPNVTYLSQVYLVDREHVALSRQFFNKTVQNISENPYAAIQLTDPVSFEAYDLDLEFVRSETSGPLFDTMFVRIEAIASHTGMKGIFKLVAADVYRIRSTRYVTGYLEPVEGEVPRAFPDPPERRSELRALQVVSDRLNRARDLDELLQSFLGALRTEMGFEHSMILLPDDDGSRLFTVASIGYGESGVGAEVPVGSGLIGTVAAQKQILRVGDIASDLRYGRAVRETTATETPEIPLPGLPDAKGHLALPLVVEDRLVGVLAVESRDPLGFDDWHEAFLAIVGNQAAIAIERILEREREEEDEPPVEPPLRPSLVGPKHVFRYYAKDETIFVDGEYLIRNVAAKILWKVLRGWVNDGRTEFSNRELRLDPWLGLPPVKDNLESRLILLRKRLEQKCSDVRIPSCARGHFRLEIDGRVALEEQAPS
ncbi:MAG: GAF domain-containing protein [Deltaproteobacteria bacterium]|nr:GAF domain-containing protein [Deltaproteobacteria bacterium]